MMYKMICVTIIGICGLLYGGCDLPTYINSSADTFELTACFPGTDVCIDISGNKDDWFIDY